LHDHGSFTPIIFLDHAFRLSPQIMIPIECLFDNPLDHGSNSSRWGNWTSPTRW